MVEALDIGRSIGAGRGWSIPTRILRGVLNAAVSRIIVVHEAGQVSLLFAWSGGRGKDQCVSDVLHTGSS